jgi:hypothetical protein
LFGLFALVPMLDTSSDGDRKDDPDFEGLGIVDTDGDADPDVEEPDVEDPDVVDPDVVAPDVVSLTGEDGTPVDVDGSELGDVIASPTAPTTPIQLNGLGGDDTIGFGYSTSVAPGLGDDELTLTITQAALDNGDGADTFNISDFFNSEAGTMFATGGEGADTFNISARNVFSDPEAGIFAQIEDFDSAEDVLRITPNHPADDVESIDIVEEPNGAYTDVNVSISTDFKDTAVTAVVTVRLIGVTGLTEGDAVTT